MRDSHLDPSSFCRQLERHATRLSEECTALRTAVVIDPNFQRYDSRVIIPGGTTLDDLIRLAIISWYFEDQRVAVLLRLALEEHKSRLCSEDAFLLDLLLHSKGEMLCFLLETSLWHTRDFFGNLIPTNDKGRFLIGKRLDRVRFLRKTTRVRHPQRKRGYDDKGSLRPSHKSPYYVRDAFVAEQEEMKQRKRNSIEATSEIVRGFVS